jgi:hypothetical protein
MTDRSEPLDLDSETARLANADSQSTGTRKPASDEVDVARAAQARAAESGDASAAIEESAQ